MQRYLEVSARVVLTHMVFNGYFKYNCVAKTIFQPAFCLDRIYEIFLLQQYLLEIIVFCFEGVLIFVEIQSAFAKNPKQFSESFKLIN